MNNKLAKVTVVKIGGATLGSHDTTIEDLVHLQQQGRLVVVVHGGGKVITEWLNKQGIPTRFVRGERVTDKPTLEVVTAVLAGLVNKEIVAAINSLGGKAIGISGVDGALIQCKIKNAELGYVGIITEVDTTLLKVLLESGYIPVISPVSFLPADKSGEAVGIVNVNADTIAGEVAAAVSAERLIFLTDVVGVCDQSGKLLPHLAPSEAEALVSSGVASGGMIPKIKACVRALSSTSTTAIMDGRQPHALLKAIEGGSKGTIIKGG